MELDNSSPEKNIPRAKIRKIDSDEITRRIDFLGQKLNIPQDQLDRARKTEILIVDKNTFFEKVQKHFKKLGIEIPEKLVINENEREKVEFLFKVLKTSAEEVSKKRNEIIKNFFDEYSETPAICYHESGLNTILINSDEIKSDEEMDEALTHELIHSIANSSDLESGFSSGGKFHNLNEAMVQMLVIKINNSDLEWSDFIDKYLSGKINNRHYNRELLTLLTIVKSTSFGKEGLYSFEEITNIYFNDQYDDGIRGILFKMNLFSKVPDKLDDDNEFKIKLLKLFEERLEGSSFYNQKRQLETNPTALKANHFD
jgi:hypothetical protein